MKSIFLVSGFLFGITSLSINNVYCSHQNNIVSDTLEIKSFHYSDNTPDSSAVINIEYPQIIYLENKVVESKINMLLEDEFKQTIEWYEEVAADSIDTGEFTHTSDYSFETSFKIKYNSKEFCCIVLDHYEYTGGAHGNYFSTGYNIRISDGELLSLQDIIKENSFDLLTYEFEEALLELYSVESIQEAPLFNEEINITDEQDFYIIPGSLVLQFDPYEIAPYSEGEIQVEIPFENIKDILKNNLPFTTK